MPENKELNSVESLFRQVGDYVETRGELFKLTAVDNASALLSTAAARVAVYVIASRTVLLLSIAAGFLLGEWLGKISYGFFVVAAAFALAGILVYLWRDKWVKDPVARLVITKALG